MTTRSEPHRILMVGLPNSGKTTFLAALWHTMTVEKEGRGRLTVRVLSGDRSYLNSIQEQWLECEQVDRTRRTEHLQSVELPLADDEGRLVNLVIPDLSGEVFQGVWEERAWPKTLIKVVRESEGILFFIHPEQRLDSALIEDADRQARIASQGEIRPDVGGGAEEREDQKGFSIEAVNHTVQLVDILQSIVLLRSSDAAMPVAVIVSAWDLIPEKIVETPEGCIRMAAPLLHQFLQSQTANFPVRYWGVSAQGGDYLSEGARLAEIHDPYERVRVVAAGEDEDHDLTRPVVWLLEEMAGRFR